ncbi:hypothetical protein M0R45_025221 [Rubus argutus]|uniref:Uncharacterized protein n=1 Tax=Rubus argutus TaxID=59490 RepID=A0AAW1WXF3_RUBAR
MLSASRSLLQHNFTKRSLGSECRDRVLRAADRKSAFRFLPTHMKHTLESLMGQGRFIREIREFDDEPSIPNHDIADLETQMIEGTRLVGKMSSIRIYNYCCRDGCVDQLFVGCLFHFAASIAPPLGVSLRRCTQTAAVESPQRPHQSALVLTATPLTSPQLPPSSHLAAPVVMKAEMLARAGL